MTAGTSIDPALTKTLDAGEFLYEQLSQASPDLMRELLATFLNALLGADADAVCGAAYGARPFRQGSGRVVAPRTHRFREATE